MLQSYLRVQVLLAAMQSVLLGDSRCANVIIPRICNVVLAAPSSTRHVSLEVVACCVLSWFRLALRFGDLLTV